MTSGHVPSTASFRGAVGARESSAGAVPSDAATEAAPSTDGIAAPAASSAREARALASAAGSDGEIYGERGASTHPFDPGIYRVSAGGSPLQRQLVAAWQQQRQHQ